MSPLRQATAAAKAEFDRTLGRDTARFDVPASVVDAANRAFAAAGGTGPIEVIGHGNTTHPVCSVSVRRAKPARR